MTNNTNFNKVKYAPRVKKKDDDALNTSKHNSIRRVAPFAMNGEGTKKSRNILKAKASG